MVWFEKFAIGIFMLAGAVVIGSLMALGVFVLVAHDIFVR